jgi:S-adenosylmethionine:tRNA ribosyltransferase-isomerase
VFLKLEDLQFEYPEDLVALEPVRPARVLRVQNGTWDEIRFSELLDLIPSGDLFVINNTKVQKRRIFCQDTEILFLFSTDGKTWEVLFPAKKFKIGDTIELPLGVTAELLQKGRPQKLKTNKILTEEYFSSAAELPLPPYIQKLRPHRHAKSEDDDWYQTEWAKALGSLASPTASLHFSLSDLDYLKNRGVQVLEVTLHVGLGTFLPVEVEDLDQHKMHSEIYEVHAQVWNAVQAAKKNGKNIWALGTTVARTLESVARSGNLAGTTDLLLQEGAEFKVVNRLLTNFHQPESTLLALVAGFVGLPLVKKAYRFAIEKRFRLFSYGDLSVWIL